MASQNIEGDLRILDGDIVLLSDGKRLLPDIQRDWIEQTTLAKFNLPPHTWGVWDSGQPLPATAASDDLGYEVGTFGTDAPRLTAGDLKAAGATTRRARRTVDIPAEYDSGQTVQIRLAAGMLTTIADTSCTIDVEAYKIGRDGLKTGSDLVSTAAMTMNSPVVGDKTFEVTAGALTPGDKLDVRISITCTDAATGTVVKPIIADLDLLCDIRG